ncbi:MAG: hypothetical protein WBZ37_11615 [Mycobacterium sp.]
MAQAQPGPFPQWCPGEFWDPLWGGNPDGFNCHDGFPGWNDHGGYGGGGWNHDDHGGWGHDDHHDDGHHDDGHYDGHR